MGARGRFRGDSDRQHQLGNPSGRRLPVHVPALAVSAAPSRPPAAPKGLGATGRATWREAWAEAPWLGVADRQTVAELARLADEVVEYRALVVEEGVLLVEPIVTPKGDVVGERKVPNPVVRMIRDAEKQALAVRMALGLTPTARARLGLAVLQAKTEETKLQKMMREARGRQ